MVILATFGVLELLELLSSGVRYPTAFWEDSAQRELQGTIKSNAAQR